MAFSLTSLPSITHSATRIKQELKKHIVTASEAKLVLFHIIRFADWSKLLLWCYSSDKINHNVHDETLISSHDLTGCSLFSDDLTKCDCVPLGRKITNCQSGTLALNTHLVVILYPWNPFEISRDCIFLAMGTNISNHWTKRNGIFVTNSSKNITLGHTQGEPRLLHPNGPATPRLWSHAVACLAWAFLKDRLAAQERDRQPH